jgi:DUF438 domain-containing protein
MALYFFTYYTTKQTRCNNCGNIFDIQEEIEEYSDGFKQVTDTYYPNETIYNIHPIKHFQENNNHCYHRLSEDKTSVNIYHNIINCKCDIIKMRHCIMNFYDRDLVIMNNYYKENNYICESCILDLLSDNVCINLTDYFNMNLDYINSLFNNMNI